jgi:DNA-binding MarR family transcriptional regulator
MAVFQHIYQSFDDKALTLVQFSVMAVAADNPGVTQSELAQVLAVERPRIVPILNRLEELGFAKRVVSEDDKRNRQIVLTASGAARLRELKRRFAVHEQELDALLGKRKAGLLDALHRLSGIGE